LAAGPWKKIEVGAFFGFPAINGTLLGMFLLHGSALPAWLRQITILSSLIACCPLIDAAPALFGETYPISVICVMLELR
jgi:hypothetical protein